MEGKHNPVETPWQITLPVLRQLSAELKAGTGALARQDLKDFEKHVAAQGELCDILQATSFFSNKSDKSQTPRLAFTRPSNVEWEAVQELDHQRRVYAALLRRAKAFVEILLTFQHSSSGYSADGRLPLNRSTWSSEV
jgi:hypothetical protein